uniref:Late embryogenesis abundant protein n=1 Tax=Plectus sambesii TaxID=2011161 RepID=A0A914X8M5_9BILA
MLRATMQLNLARAVVCQANASMATTVGGKQPYNSPQQQPLNQQQQRQNEKRQQNEQHQQPEGIIDKTKDVLHDVAEKAKEALNTAKDTVFNSNSTMAEKAKDTLNSAKDTVYNAAEKTKDFYKENVENKAKSAFGESAEETAARKVRNAATDVQKKVSEARDKMADKTKSH